MSFQLPTLMRRGVGSGFALLAGFAALSIAPAAHAHGGIPHAFGIIIQPDDPKHMILRSDIWGFMRSADGGNTWEWSCAEVYGGQSLSAQHRSILIAAGGRILVASEFSGLRYTDDFCDWKPATELASELVEDVTQSGSALYVLSATGGDAGIRGAIWKSTDNGNTWKETGTPLPNDFAGKTLKLAPSDPKRIYVTGRKLGPQTGELLTSSDAGATWQRQTIPVADQDASLRIQAIHPTRPDVVLVWSDAAEGYGQNSPDSVWMTGDAGKTWVEAYSSDGDLPGLALSPDGATVAIAGPLEGVHTAKLDDALSKGKDAFTQTFQGQVWGLNWTEAGLYAGNDNFTARGIPAYMLGLSSDDGHTFEEQMDICQITYPACGASTTLEQSCNNYWNMESGFSSDFAHGPRCTGGGGASGSGGASTSGGGATSSGAGGQTASNAGAPGSAGAPVSPSGGSGPDTHGRGTSSKSSCSYSNSNRGPEAFSVVAALGLLASAVRRRRSRESV